MRWQRAEVPMEINGLTSVTTYTTRMGEYLMQVVNAGGGVCRSLNDNEILHWIIGICKPTDLYKTRVTGKEPSYEEKLRVLKELGKWRQVALEVMPPESEVVDIDDVYHIWEFEYIYSFIANVVPIFTRPQSFEQTYKGIEYHVETIGKVRYLYFRTDGKLGWKKKQELKNHVFFCEDTGVEIICSEMSSCDYSCLIVLPPLQFLDFGLQ